MTTAPQAGTPGFEGTGPNAPGRVIARLGAFGSRTASAGAVAPGAGDRFASVYLDTTTEAAKQEASFLVLACQNGAATFSKSAPSCFMGDTAIKVALEVCPGDPGSAILEVSARLRPGHLTHAFVCRNRVALRDAEAFWTMSKLTRSYVFTVALRGQLDLANLYIVKYHAEGGPRARPRRLR